MRARAAQQQGANGTILGDRLEFFDHYSGHRGGEGVAFFRLVESDDENRAAGFEQDFRGHRMFLRFSLLYPMPLPRQGGINRVTTMAEILIETQRIGMALRVTAVDAATGTEVVFQAPAASSREGLQRLAAAKLSYVMRKESKDGA